MIIKYANKKVEKICISHNEAVKELGNRNIAKALEMLMLDLRNVQKFQDFYTKPFLKPYRAHELVGDKKGITSLSINYAYRLTGIVTIQIKEDEITILEVSKHYGD